MSPFNIPLMNLIISNNQSQPQQQQQQQQAQQQAQQQSQQLQQSQQSQQSQSQQQQQQQQASSSSTHQLQLQQLLQQLLLQTQQHQDASLIALQLLQHSKFINNKTNSRKPYTEEEVFALIDLYAKYTSNGLNVKQRFNKLGPNKTLNLVIAEEMTAKFPNSLKVFDKENIRKKLDEIKMEYLVFRYLSYKSSGFGWLASEGRFNMDILNIDYYKREYVEMGGPLNGKTDTFKKLMKHGNFYIYHYHELIGRNLQFDLDFDKGNSSVVVSQISQQQNNNNNNNNNTTSNQRLTPNVNIEPELIQQQQQQHQREPSSSPSPPTETNTNTASAKRSSNGGRVSTGVNQTITKGTHYKRSYNNMTNPSSSSSSSISEDDLLLDIVNKISNDESEIFKFSELCELVEKYRVVRRLLISDSYDYEYKKRCLREF